MARFKIQDLNLESMWHVISDVVKLIRCGEYLRVVLSDVVSI